MDRICVRKWSKREQLCLASAMQACDQDWLKISSIMKMLCSNNNRSPPEYFSQKICESQYEKMCEFFETPKRKKRANQIEDDPQTPTEEKQSNFMVRQLAEERVEELEMKIRQNQEEYGKICAEIEAIQNDELTEEELLEMERLLEQEEEADRIEQMKLENQLRERENELCRKQEMRTGNWHATDTTPVDMDVEEIAAGTSTAKAPSVSIVGTQQQLSLQQSTLLSSLLKSPIVTTAPSFPSNTSTNSASSTAPTITTLLTSGSIPNKNQPTIVLKSTISPNEAANLLTRPISGPATDVLIVSAANQQVLLSPSQSAPTLSMLLEKKNVTVAVDVQGVQGSCSEVKEESKTTHASVISKTESNNEELPMDIEDVADSIEIKNNLNVTGGAEPLEEHDCNEEEAQLLEVFKNIGNIDELDIDVAAVIDGEEDDFLGSVVDDSRSNDAAGTIDLENKIETNIIEVVGQQQKSNISIVKNEENSEAVDNPVNIDESKDFEDLKLNVDGNIKVETVSSDDSNDNIPLSAVASFETKDHSNLDEKTSDKDFLIENMETTIKKEEEACNTDWTAESKLNNDEEVETVSESPSSLKQAENVVNAEDADSETQKSPKQSSKNYINNPNSDDDESNGEQQLGLSKEEPIVGRAEQEEVQIITADASDDKEVNGQLPSTSLKSDTEEATSTTPINDADATELETNPPTQQETNPFADTDEDSSMTDVSIITRKDETIITSLKQKARKSMLEPIVCLHDPKIVTTVPAKPPVLRKLRDRNRSESPMIDDETNISITGGDQTSNQRSMRRYSSTPVIDSRTNSPTSDFERETRSTRKSLIKVVNTLLSSKHAVVFQRIFNEEHTHKHDKICLRSMDLQTIKRNVESGLIRNIRELQRDIMLMCQNAFMLINPNSVNFKAFEDFMRECQSIHEFVANPNKSVALKISNEASTATSKENKSSVGSGVKVRGSSRKSLRIA